MRSLFKKGQRVVKLLIGAGMETASIQEVEWVRKDKVKLVDDEAHEYSSDNGRVLIDYIPGFTSRIVILED